uniref:Uncharacterized protein n=1 Tax=Candidatus Kentrum eta TaxID=2126337 RepID=A0A450V5A4_9GAMM|nr:MAG: hypothetical protein BECKH772B_GA0070898_1001828 [Candidatus Kentron sp. H]VFJ99958.1 MAG: hypothetical protein BECKH772A_GA0070896_101779 [Candidatus Kentron sp. H]
MRIYPDNCCFNRPFDDQSSLTIWLETEAKLAIQEKIESGVFAPGWSTLLDYENGANPFRNGESRFRIQWESGL